MHSSARVVRVRAGHTEQEMRRPPRPGRAPVGATPGCACGGRCPRCQARSGLVLGAVDDACERHADAVADRVMGIRGGASPRAGPGSVGVTPAARLGADTASAIAGVVATPGQGLDAATRGFFAPRFHTQIAAVRLHWDPRAAASAEQIQAAAYNLGPHIVFGPGRYQPHTLAGRRLLAHELAHVAQGDQAGGTANVIRRAPAEGPAAPSRREVRRLDELVKAIESGDQSSTEKLLDRGVSVDSRGDGRPLVWLAAFAGQPAIIELLAARGADLDQPADDQDRTTPLIMAVKEGHLAAVQTLIRLGARPDQADGVGTTPLLHAAYLGQLACLQALAGAGVDPLASQADGYNPLLAAASGCQAAVVEWLLGQGADPRHLANMLGSGEIDAATAATRSKERAVAQMAEAQGFERETGQSLDVSAQRKKLADCDQVLALLGSR